MLFEEKMIKLIVFISIRDCEVFFNVVTIEWQINVGGGVVLIFRKV